MNDQRGLYWPILSVCQDYILHEITSVLSSARFIDAFIVSPIHGYRSNRLSGPFKVSPLRTKMKSRLGLSLIRHLPFLMISILSLLFRITARLGPLKSSPRMGMVKTDARWSAWVSRNITVSLVPPNNFSCSVLDIDWMDMVTVGVNLKLAGRR